LGLGRWGEIDYEKGKVKKWGKRMDRRKIDMGCVR
jgi:hypothetical protein